MAAGLLFTLHPTGEVVTHSSDGRPPITKSEDAFPVSGSLTGTMTMTGWPTTT